MKKLGKTKSVDDKLFKKLNPLSRIRAASNLEKMSPHETEYDRKTPEPVEIDKMEVDVDTVSKSETVYISSGEVNEIEEIENAMFKVVKTPIKRFFVNISDENKIWTLTANTTSKNTPIVIVHGFCGGIGFWIQNVDTFAENHPFYAFDLLGFGRSSRSAFSEDPAEAEEQFLDSIERWRKIMKIEEMILFGHSFGGFLATAFSIKYPQYVKALILIDPWGFTDNPRINRPDNSKALWIKAANRIQSRLGPLDLVRVSGPVGLTMFRVVRPNYKRYFDSILDDPNIVYRYIYFANLPNPTGETAFKNMSEMMFYAKCPVIRRIDHLESRIPIWFVYGRKSFIDSAPSFEVEKKRKNCAPVSIKIIDKADHHVYALQAKEFNKHIKTVLENIRNKSYDST